MPFVLNCPHCHGPLTVHESQANQTVSCPHCRRPMQCTVATPTPVEPSPELAPTSRNLRHRSDTGIYLTVGGFGVTLVGLLGLGVWSLLREPVGGEAKKPPETKTSPPAPRPRVAPPIRVVTPPTQQPEEPPKTDDERFAADWAAAWRASEPADLAEPESTRQALAVLTFGERSEAALAMAATGASLFSGAGKLSPLGLSAWVGRESRKFARGDAAFKKVARSLWNFQKEPRTILAAAEAWGTFEPAVREGVITVTENHVRTLSLQPEVRDAVLALGGRGWLEKH